MHCRTVWWPQTLAPNTHNATSKHGPPMTATQEFSLTRCKFEHAAYNTMVRIQRALEETNHEATAEEVEMVVACADTRKLNSVSPRAADLDEHVKDHLYKEALST